jgi:hypothetical protein
MTISLQILGFLGSLLCVAVTAAPFILLAIVALRKTDSAYREMLANWARENDWQIIRCKRREFGSPWMFMKSQSQSVYHLTVQYDVGGPRIRRAWVKCGGWLLGPRTAKVEMSWDGVSQPAPPPEPEPPPSRPQDDPLWDAMIDG